MVDKRIKKTIKELQSLSTLQLFFLVGRTNLALRFNHRESEDIDLFCQEKIGVSGFKEIEKEIKEKFGDRILFVTFPVQSCDNIVFLKGVIRTEGLDIKVEFIQSHMILNEIENIKDIRMASVEDVAVFKIASICNRKALKDLFDLDCITDKVLSLQKIIERYSYKKLLDNRVTIFNYAKSNCPLDNPEYLYGVISDIGAKVPYHGNPNIIKGVERERVIYVKSNWKIKVRTYINSLSQ